MNFRMNSVWLPTQRCVLVNRTWIGIAVLLLSCSCASTNIKTGTRDVSRRVSLGIDMTTSRGSECSLGVEFTPNGCTLDINVESRERIDDSRVEIRLSSGETNLECGERTVICDLKFFCHCHGDDPNALSSGNEGQGDINDLPCQEEEAPEGSENADTGAPDELSNE